MDISSLFSCLSLIAAVVSAYFAYRANSISREQHIFDDERRIIERLSNLFSVFNEDELYAEEDRAKYYARNMVEKKFLIKSLESYGLDTSGVEKGGEEGLVALNNLLDGIIKKYNSES